jgi:hypothetical protein
MLMVLSGLQMLLFTIGVMRRSYVAIALPMLAVIGAVSGVLFWVGYTMANTQTDLSELDLEDEITLEASA